MAVCACLCTSFACVGRVLVCAWRMGEVCVEVPLCVCVCACVRVRAWVCACVHRSACACMCAHLCSCMCVSEK